MRRISLTAFIGVLLLAGCAPQEQTKPDEIKKSDFKVALITPGPISDAGWNAMAYEGLTAIRDGLDAEVNNQEAKGAQIRDALRSYAQKDYDLIFGHGFEYNEPAIEVAKDFPKSVFISSSGGKTAPNAGAFRFYLEQGFYLCGYLAGLSSKSGVVAMIGGDDVPSIRSTFKGFKAGAEAARPGIRVIETFTGNGTDIAAAKQATLQAIGEGADFVVHQANNAAQGVFDACKEKGVLAFGANADQNENPSGVVVASAVINAKPAFVKLAERVKKGEYKGEIVLMGMEDNAILFVLNSKLEGKLPGGAKDKVLLKAAEIQKGELQVPKDDF
jgi:basic membrane protein A and related proteins